MNVNNNVTLQMGFFLMLESQTVSNNVDRNVMMPVHHLICVNLTICVAACLWVIAWFLDRKSFLGQRPFLDCTLPKQASVSIGIKMFCVKWNQSP